jgi:hypothetical protein
MLRALRIWVVITQLTHTDTKLTDYVFPASTD